jgi:hypothetical protein
MIRAPNAISDFIIKNELIIIFTVKLLSIDSTLGAGDEKWKKPKLRKS